MGRPMKFSNAAVDTLVPFKFRTPIRNQYDMISYVPIGGMSAEQLVEVATKVAPKAYELSYWKQVMKMYPKEVYAPAVRVLLASALEQATKALGQLERHSITPCRRVLIPTTFGAPGLSSVYRQDALSVLRERLERADPQAALLYSSESMYTGACVFCGRIKQVYMQPDWAEAPGMRMWFEPISPLQSEPMTYLAQVHGWALDHGYLWYTVLGVCNGEGCNERGSCRLCGRILSPTFNLSEIVSFAGDGTCVPCGGGALYMMAPPKLNGKEMREFARRMREKKGGMVV